MPYFLLLMLLHVPLYRASCKHLGHSADTCFVANLGLWEAWQPVGQVQDTVVRDKGKVLMSNAAVHPKGMAKRFSH
ncbi:hypothetical protein WN944_015324 [Citrus x changshan-huyou]|uniref:Secreted protein n=1 Tax=Citrus x changshan-huyou TaxID=2935761 RepID=A0AAP0MA08_9ROSI